MIETVRGSVLSDIKDYSVILHQCNAKGWMGAGIAKQIRERWPECFKSYHSYCGWFKDGHEHEIMGTWHFWKVSNKLIICNAIAQATVSRDKQVTDYDAWERICRKLESQTRSQNKAFRTDWTIHAPDRIGCGLGGGDYEQMHAIFEKYFADSPVRLVFHSLGDRDGETVKII